MPVILAEGHRGFCARYPENTLPSFRAAVELGVDAIEFDVWLSSDKIPVIMHDGHVRRTTGGEGHLRDLTLGQIRQLDAQYTFGEEFAGVRVPTLDETLEIICADRRISPGVEIKEYTEQTADLTVAALKNFGCLDRCFFYCFNARIIKYLKKKYGVLTMGYPKQQMSEFGEDSYDYYDEAGISMGILTPELCEEFRQRNKPLHIYCCDNDETVYTALEQSPKLITANDPVPLMRILREKGIHAAHEFPA